MSWYTVQIYVCYCAVFQQYNEVLYKIKPIFSKIHYILSACTYSKDAWISSWRLLLVVSSAIFSTTFPDSFCLFCSVRVLIARIFKDHNRAFTWEGPMPECIFPKKLRLMFISWLENIHDNKLFKNIIMYPQPFIILVHVFNQSIQKM